MVKATPQLTTSNNTAIDSLSRHSHQHSFIHPLKDYSLKSIGTFLYKNLEIIIFIVLALILITYFAYRAKERFENADKPRGINEMDAIVYINLENRGDRKDLLLKELEKLDTDMGKVHKITGVYMPGNGHKGCVQAHILALELAKLNNWEHTLILEDDAELAVSTADFNAILNASLEKLKLSNTQWDVIMLAAANKVWDAKSSHSLDVTILSHPTVADTENTDTNSAQAKTQEKTVKLKKLETATTSSAYIVRREYIDTILEVFRECNAKMSHATLSGDNYEQYALDQYWAKIQRTGKWYALDEDPIKQRAIWSTIMKSHAKQQEAKNTTTTTPFLTAI